MQQELKLFLDQTRTIKIENIFLEVAASLKKIYIPIDLEVCGLETIDVSDPKTVLLNIA